MVRRRCHTDLVHHRRLRHNVLIFTSREPLALNPAAAGSADLICGFHILFNVALPRRIGVSLIKNRKVYRVTMKSSVTRCSGAVHDPNPLQSPRVSRMHKDTPDQVHSETSSRRVDKDQEAV